MNFKKSRTIMWIGCIAGLLMFAPAMFAEEPSFNTLTIAGLVVYFVTFIQAIIFYRCPFCGYSLLNVKGRMPDFCPRCSGNLQDADE